MSVGNMRSVFNNNIKIVKLINELNRGRVFMTSLYWACDMCEIIIYNLLLLPFLYYAVDHNLPVENFLIIECSLIAMVIACDFYQTYYNRKYLEKSNQRITHTYNLRIFEHIRKDDLERFCHPEYKDKIMRLLDLGVYNITSALDMQWWGISVIVLGAAYIYMLAQIDYFLIIVAVVSSFLAFVLNIKINKVSYQIMVEENAVSRKLDYVVRVHSLRDYLQDLQTTGLGAVFGKTLSCLTLEIQKIAKTITAKMSKYLTAKNILIFIVSTTITWIYLAVKYLDQGTIALSTADIIVSQTVMQQLCNMLMNISDIGPGLQRNSIYVDEYFAYIKSAPDIPANKGGKQPKEGANGIRIRDVSFSYDGEKEVLSHINMDIRAGEKVAIVGENGAGKSTLVKLLLRLYIPSEGEIELDEVPAQEYDLEAYRDRFGVAFQDTRLYCATVAENVLMDICTEGESERVVQALESSGIYSRVAEAARGIETTVTREFDPDGIEFSGGQAQKIALARVFARDSGIVILDEPSAALDPMSEAEMFDNMLRAAEKRTVVMISHRLSACRGADTIYVLSGGRIVERGTHQELTAAGGMYANMWRTQASGYTDLQIVGEKYT